MISKGYSLESVNTMTVRQLHLYGAALVARLEAEANAYRQARQRNTNRRR